MYSVHLEREIMLFIGKPKGRSNMISNVEYMYSIHLSVYSTNVLRYMYNVHIKVHYNMYSIEYMYSIHVSVYSTNVLRYMYNVHSKVHV